MVANRPAGQHPVLLLSAVVPLDFMTVSNNYKFTYKLLQILVVQKLILELLGVQQ